MRVIKKIKDLDGLENGLGLTLKYCDSFFTGDLNCVDKNGDIIIKGLRLSQVKQLGFTFEVGLQRTVKDILKEIEERESLPLSMEEDRYTVVLKVDKKFKSSHYEVFSDKYNRFVGAVYMDKVVAERYVNELNNALDLEG